MHFTNACRPLLAAALCCLLLVCPPASRAGLVDDWIQSFADSEIVFQRSTSNVPFLPLGYLDLSLYHDTEVSRPDADPLLFDLTTASQGAVLPFLVSPTDALFVGEWVGLTRFKSKNSESQSFDVLSVGLPVGWLSQVNPDWQSGAFVMPLFHRADLDNSDWSHEVLGGVFARYVQSDRLWWVFGFYFDAGPGDDIYLPYLGATWELDDELTLSAVLPWPAVLYSPDRNWLYRFGASPSGTSWSLNSTEDEVSFDLDTWNLGVSVERRVHGNFWGFVEAGIGGLRALRLEGNQFRGSEFDIDASTFVKIGINFRPQLP